MLILVVVEISHGVSQVSGKCWFREFVDVDKFDVFMVHSCLVVM